MKKGFTLIELLAVIAILAIILLIAVPTILTTINNSKVESFENNARLLIHTIDVKALENSFDPTTITESNLTALTGIDSSDYRDLIVTKENGETVINIIGQNKWDGLVAHGDRNTISSSTQKYLTTVEKYGSSISSLYGPLYGTWKVGALTKTDSADTYYDGNYAWPRSLDEDVNGTNSAYGITMTKTILSHIDDTNTIRQRVYSGTNIYNLDTISNPNRWLFISINAGNLTTSAQIGALKLIFEDNAKYNLTNAAANGYIETLVITSASSTSTSYVWGSSINLLLDGNTTVKSYPLMAIWVKVKDKGLKGLEFYANRDFNSTDGIRVNQYSWNYDLSLVPFQ